LNRFSVVSDEVVDSATPVTTTSSGMSQVETH
jgi:hypothetical protein